MFVHSPCTDMCSEHLARTVASQQLLVGSGALDQIVTKTIVLGAYFKCVEGMVVAAGHGDPSACVFASKAISTRRPRGFDQCGQATKGAWGMSWRQKAMKGVEVCEKSGGVDKRALIPEFPN